jgi:two-component system cell cycle response regulator
MNIKLIKANIPLFIFSYILVVVIFLFVSYKFIMSDFIMLEKNQNQHNVNTILKSMDTNIESISNIIDDYSKWDDSYDFILNENKDYIYENFRKGTNTLNDLDVDFIIYSNKEQKVLFSKYRNKVLETDNKLFEIEVLNKFKNLSNENTIIEYKSHYLYLVKAEILKSDETGDVNGWIFSGKIITNRSLGQISKAFNTINITNVPTKETDSVLSFPYLKNVKIKTSLNSENLTNVIQFYNNNYIFSIITENKRDIVNNGEKTVLYFNLIIDIFILIIFYIIYRNQIMIIQYNELLELKVTRRTKQLTYSLRKIKDKNIELYTLANVDSLTKIKNRRSYFKKSESLLKKAISEEKALCILMIDIDHFKKVNDTYGHAIGDKVLIEFCTIINSIIDDEVFGRIGGEEFCITFFDKNENEISIIAEKIRLQCEESLLTVENHTIGFTVSLGLSCRANFDNVDEILQVSDELLYQAKKSGRNRLIRNSR